MANKRMFSMFIVDSDAFLDMPLSAQCLYFHLNMRADDDGFIGNPKRIQRLIGACDDDLSLLVAKRFLLTFDDGVIVIKHWRMHNTLSKSRYHETQYIDEKNALMLKKNKSYSFTDGVPLDDKKLVEMHTGDERRTSGEQTENKRRTSGEQTENSDIDIGLDIDKDIDLDLGLDKDLDKEKGSLVISDDITRQTSNEVQQAIEYWNTIGVSPVVRVPKSSNRYKMLRSRISEYGLEEVLKAMDKIGLSDFLRGSNKSGWTITLDWFVKPNNFPKVLEGNYDNKKSTAQVDSNSTIDWEEVLRG